MPVRFLLNFGFQKFCFCGSVCMGGNGNGNFRWKFSFLHRRKSRVESNEPPKEFICTVSCSLMADPVVVSSGQTFERVSAQVCRNLGFSPVLEDGSKPDFSTVIPNLAMKKTILHWCEKSGARNPQAPDYSSVERRVSALMEQEKPHTGIRDLSDRDLLEGVSDLPSMNFSHAATEYGRRPEHFYTSSSEESVIVGGSPGTPLPFTIRPVCYSFSSSSSENVENNALIQALGTNSSIGEEENKFLAKLESPDVFEQEEGIVSLRKVTKADENIRVSLCTPRILSSLHSLVTSRYPKVQINAVASLVNLSLEKPNKLKIARSGLVPHLIDALKGGHTETQEHAAEALFSLALEDENRMAIGFLGAMPPLLYALRSENERTRDVSALCLYNLTMIQSNRVKLVKLGAVTTLLSMVKSRNSTNWLLLILCNIAVCQEGRSAMLDGDAVGLLVGMLREKELDSESARENCVAALYALSYGSMRFKGLAKEAGAMEVLREIIERGSERAREKAKKILERMRTRGRSDDDGDRGGESSFERDGLSSTGYRMGGGRIPSSANTMPF
ncbi:U-box domain-containing protein 38-like isoform X1 [Cucurbita pepo subsp. pepo]|uniref:U-box domain-containing protein 38-like isoform X1 n=2 Tax=Cucurbita pepo subsp. pepo TaxID=3664 RepID=UPI000C9D2918|nr:U-box domain-containing protein 38-like isoform X1 [Cucurbita pepo subsp. pepo]